GRLRLGSGTSAAALDLAARLGAFRQAYPQVEISLSTDAPAVLLDQLRSGELDAALLPERARGRSLDHKLLGEDEWLVVAPSGYPWSGDAPVLAAPATPDVSPEDFPSLTPDQLRGQPVTVVSDDSRLGLNARLELPALLEERGVPWRDVPVVLELPTELAV